MATRGLQRVLLTVPAHDDAAFLCGLAAPRVECGAGCCDGRLGLTGLHAGHIGHNLICGGVVNLQQIQSVVHNAVPHRKMVSHALCGQELMRASQVLVVDIR